MSNQVDNVRWFDNKRDITDNQIRIQNQYDSKPCPTCQNGRTRETVNMVCQTCGRDYMLTNPSRQKSSNLSKRKFHKFERQKTSEQSP